MKHGREVGGESEDESEKVMQRSWRARDVVSAVAG